MNQIKITPGATASFDIDLQGARYTFTFVYNARMGVWFIKLALAGVVLVPSQAAVMGVMLFRGYADPRIPTGLYLAPLDDSTEDATYNELGARVVLMEITAEDGINVPI
jgi:hypothetical protein